MIDRLGGFFAEFARNPIREQNRVRLSSARARSLAERLLTALRKTGLPRHVASLDQSGDIDPAHPWVRKPPAQ